MKKHSKDIKLLFSFFAFVVVGLLLNGCSGMSLDDAVNNADSYATFQNKLEQVTEESAENPNYKPIPIESSADQTWFVDLAYKYWKKDITLGQFVQEGVGKYPGYGDSFKFIASQLL